MSEIVISRCVRRAFVRLLIAYSCVLSQSAFAADGPATVNVLLKKAEEAHAAGRLSVAANLYRDAIRKQPDNAAAHLGAAQVYREAAEEWGSSDELLGRSAWLAPRDWKLHSQASFRFSVLGETGLSTKSNFDGALPIEVLRLRQLAEGATKLAPQDAEAAHVLGYAHYLVGEHDQAERCLLRAVDLAPQDAALHDQIGLFYSKIKNYREAVQHSDEAVQLAPDVPRYRWARCHYSFLNRDIAATTRDLLQLGVSDETAEALKRRDREPRAYVGLQLYELLTIGITVIRDDQKPQCYQRRAEYLLSVGDDKRALEDIDAALALQPGCTGTQFRRVQTLTKLGRLEEAARLNDELGRKRPYSFLVEEARADILKALGQHRESQLASERAEWLKKWMQTREQLADAPDDLAAWHQAGSFAVMGQEWSVATTCFERLVGATQEPYSALAHAGLAKVHLQRGEHQTAIDFATRALDQRTTLALMQKRGEVKLLESQRRELDGALSTRAEARVALKDFDGAIADFEAVNAFGTEVAEAYRGRAKIREKNGEAVAAAADRERARQLDPFGVADGVRSKQ